MSPRLRSILYTALFVTTASCALIQFSHGAVIRDWFICSFVLLQLGAASYLLFWRFDKYAVQYGPEFLTTLGILGCFLSVAMSMSDFDAKNITQSVPHVLQGVKTAFWSSVCGIFGGLFIRIWQRLGTTGGGTPSGVEQLVQAMQAIQQSLVGDTENSVVGQLKGMRKEQNDQMASLRGCFTTFSGQLAEDSSQVLIGALRGVVKDFNVQINDQFGENFVHLNEAVRDLVVWQEQYKEHLDRLHGLQRASAEDLRLSVQRMSTMVERSQAFTETAANLKTVLQGLAQQQQTIEGTQETIADILDQMHELAPALSLKVDELVSSMGTGVSNVHNEVGKIIHSFGTGLEQSSADMKRQTVETVLATQKAVNSELQKGLNVIRQTVITLDAALKEELTKSLESLGRQLASLSEKFVDDYGPLTDRLREVVQMVKAVPAHGRTEEEPVAETGAEHGA